MKLGHIETIKKMNRELVIKTIRIHQPISRSNVSKVLTLSRSTVSSIVDELINEKIVTELGFGDSGKEGGRRGIQLGFNSKVGYMIGIEIKKDFISGCLTDLDGRILTTLESAFDSKVINIVTFINKIIQNSKVNIDKILSIGCSVPGLVDSINGIVIDAPELNWDQTLLSQEINEHFNCAIFINNNVNCLAMAEKWGGNAQDCENFIYILIESGIGSAIVANDNLVSGFSHTAGEVGYFSFPSDHKMKNRYGDFGVFDRKASLLAFPLEMRNNIQQQKYNQLSNFEKSKFDELLYNLAFGIGNMVSLLNPEKIVLGGSLGNLINERREELEKLISDITPIEYQLEFSRMSSNSAALGSITLALDQIPKLI